MSDDQHPIIMIVEIGVPDGWNGYPQETIWGKQAMHTIFTLCYIMY